MVVEEFRYETDAYTQYAIAHTSDGIRVTSLMNIPRGEGPFPVVLVLHGGRDQSVYAQGDGTIDHADYYARQGYLALMPDYRSYNGTQGTGTPLKIPWAIDVMNLIAALPTIPEADPSRIGVMGHSRGGGIASYVMVLSDDVDAVILYAPLHTDQAVVWDAYHYTFGSSWPAFDAAIIGTPEENPEGYAMASPANYLNRIRMPVQIHHGTDDPILPAAWSRDLHTTMLDLGLVVEYYEYPGALHSFRGDDLQTFWQRNVAFFDRYVRP
ncbi:MAG: alpha/beta hydrolase family protein [Anaerolineae bacterium]